MTLPAITISSDVVDSPSAGSLLIGPGPSQVMIAGSWSRLTGTDAVQHELEQSLPQELERVGREGVGLLFTGRRRHGLMAESVAIIIAIAAGLTGGLLSAVGKDIWELLKKGCAHLLTKNSSRENLVEISVELRAYDVVVRAEPRSVDDLCAYLDEAFQALTQLDSLSQDRPGKFVGVGTIQLSKTQGSREWSIIRHRYRRIPLMVEKTPAQGSPASQTTKAPKRYHKKGCRYYRGDSEVSMERARELGQQPCKVCKPW